jgi:hypothetical protein
MFPTALSILGLAVGQAPVTPMPMGSTVPQVPAPVAAADCATCPESETPEATKYFAEKLLAGTRVGQIMECRGIKFYGWVQASSSTGSTRNSTLPGAPFADRSNEFTLNQAYAITEKPIDWDRKEFQLGFRTDAFIGHDARFTIMRDLWDYQIRNGDPLPYDMPQFYVEAFLPNLFGGTSVKAGRILTLCEYETVPGITTPFTSRSYLFQYNPFSHFGVMATTPVGDNLTVSYGAVVGTDNFIGPTNRLTFHGGLKWAPKDGDTTFTLNALVTNPEYQTGQAYNHYNAFNFQMTHKLTEKLLYAADSTYSYEKNLPIGADGNSATSWYGVAQYLAYEHNKCWTSNARFELFQDEDGWRTGTRGLYTSVTYGLNWTPTDALLIRPEFRYDNNINAPFEGGEKNLFVAALSAFWRF